MVFVACCSNRDDRTDPQRGDEQVSRGYFHPAMAVEFARGTMWATAMNAQKSRHRRGEDLDGALESGSWCRSRARQWHTTRSAFRSAHIRISLEPTRCRDCSGLWMQSAGCAVGQAGHRTADRVGK